MTELNPDHPVTQVVHDHWHKLCALLMHKFGTQHVVITDRDIAGAFHGGGGIVVQELDDGLHLRLVDGATAERLAKIEGSGQ